MNPVIGKPLGQPVKDHSEWKVKMPWGVETRKTKKACIDLVKSWCEQDPKYKKAVEENKTDY
jgi:hypothetical protein